MKINTDREKVIKLRKDGKSYGEIAKEVKRSRNTVKSWIRRHNERMDPIKEEMRKELNEKNEYKKKIKQLEMELELLKDFLYETERGNVEK